MNEDADTHILVIRIQEWLDHPQSHLKDQSRRRVLELMVSEHVDKVRRQERTRSRAKDFLLMGAVLTFLGGLAPVILSFFGVTFK